MHQHKAMLNMPDNLQYWMSRAIFCQNSCNSFEDKTCRQTDRWTKPPNMHSYCALCKEHIQ